MQTDEENSDEPQPHKINGMFKKIILEKEKDDMLNLENLKDIIRQNEQQGILLPYQTKMIENVLNFKYFIASDIMTHRINITAIDELSVVSDVVRLSFKSGLSRIPVFKQNIDTIVGVVFVKDLLKLINKPDASSAPIKPFVHDLLYIPKSMKCFDLFLELTRNHMHLAVVVDDFGGTFGIVTIEDIVETIFGQIQDEFDNEVEEIKKINDKTFIIQGFANLNDVCYAIDLKIDKNLDCETLSGFLINLLGRIPEPNEQTSLTYKNITFTILSIEQNHIAKVKACKS